MPNWCKTNITFFSESEDHITKLNDALCKLDAGKSLLPNGFGNLWLGNILHYFGFQWTDVICRGSISLIGILSKDADRGFHFEIEQEDAWYANTEVWDKILSKEDFSDIHYVFMAEEPGCNVYVNSDSSGLFYDTRYMVDVCLDGKFSNDKTYDYTQEYFPTENDCLAYLRKISDSLGNKQEFTSVEEANKWFKDFLDDDTSWVTAFEFTNE